MKTLEIATATVSTLAGAVGAFMGTWQDKTIHPIWLRGVLAGTNAASVLAAGIAQIAQISGQIQTMIAASERVFEFLEESEEIEEREVSKR